jgi:hypothetical protein
MDGLEQLMQQADFAADILLLRRGQLSPPLVGSALSDWLITNSTLCRYTSPIT